MRSRARVAANRSRLALGTAGVKTAPGSAGTAGANAAAATGRPRVAISTTQILVTSIDVVGGLPSANSSQPSDAADFAVSAAAAEDMETPQNRSFAQSNSTSASADGAAKAINPQEGFLASPLLPDTQPSDKQTVGASTTAAPAPEAASVGHSRHSALPTGFADAGGSAEQTRPSAPASQILEATPAMSPTTSPATPLGLESKASEAALELQRAATHAWGEVLLAGGLALAVMWVLDGHKRFEFSISYLMVYNIILIRGPDLLGTTVMFTFGDARLYSSPKLATSAISCAYMAAMQAYIVFLQWVCQNMSSSHLFPRFHFVAQMYYYLFWYMMLMVVSPAGVEDWHFWMMVAMLNGNSLVSNSGVLQHILSWMRCRLQPPDPPLKILFDSKMAVQDQLADIMSLLIIPAVATSFQICSLMNVAHYPSGALISLWQRFGVLLLARLVSGLFTEEIFRRRVDLLSKADAMELRLLPDRPQHRLRYLNDVCVGPKLVFEPMRNIERCELYFAAVAVSCTFAVFQRGDIPARYAFIAFGA